MMSPLEKRLLAALDVVAVPEQRGQLLAELAGYWARIGEASRAEKVRLELRREFGDGRNLRISVLIMVVEALQAYYSALSPLARDRMLRASLLSKGSRDPTLIALTSAWMAHIELNQARFDSMLSELISASDALRVCGTKQGFAACRFALTLGDAHLLAGQPDIAQTWYEAARREANEIGDHAAIGAMTYNRAALRVARARFDAIAGADSGIDLSLLRIDVDSAINYQSVAQLQSLDHLLATAQASLHILQRNFETALKVIPKLLSSGEIPSPSVQRLVLHADLALALAHAQSCDEALKELETSVALYSEVGSIPTDDQCLIAASVLEAARLCGRVDIQEEWSVQLVGAVERHSLVCADLAAKLLRFPPPHSGAAA